MVGEMRLFLWSTLSHGSSAFWPVWKNLELGRWKPRVSSKQNLMGPSSESLADKNADNGELDHEDLEESKDEEKG